MKKKPIRRNQSELAAELSLSRGTVVKYLSMKGAPKRDRWKKYDREQVRAWIADQGSANIEGSEVRTFRTLKLRLETERQQFELSKSKGEYISKKTIGPTVEAAMAEFTANMIQKFSQELPGKYKGRGSVECQQMNDAAIDFILRRFKEGLWALTLGEETPAAT
jgi:predicted transcriptional regulator